jgi:hypothetical protein
LYKDLSQAQQEVRGERTCRRSLDCAREFGGRFAYFSAGAEQDELDGAEIRQSAARKVLI